MGGRAVGQAQNARCTLSGGRQSLTYLVQHTLQSVGGFQAAVSDSSCCSDACCGWKQKSRLVLTARCRVLRAVLLRRPAYTPRASFVSGESFGSGSASCNRD